MLPLNIACKHEASKEFSLVLTVYCAAVIRMNKSRARLRSHARRKKEESLFAQSFTTPPHDSSSSAPRHYLSPQMSGGISVFRVRRYSRILKRRGKFLNVLRCRGKQRTCCREEKTPRWKIQPYRIPLFAAGFTAACESPIFAVAERV